MLISLTQAETTRIGTLEKEKTRSIGITMERRCIAGGFWCAASIISGQFWSQFLWSCPSNCAIMVLTVLFARSVGFSCGVYGSVNCWLIPISARKLLRTRLANCTPFSDRTTFGTPHLAIMRSLNTFLSYSAVALRRGTSSVHFENLSIMTSSIWLPCLDLGRGPTKSAHTVAHGSFGTWVNILPTACIWLGLNRMQITFVVCRWFKKIYVLF